MRNNKIGHIIKEARRNKKITQADLADAMRISRGYLSDLENGRYIPNTEMMSRIAVRLDIDLNLLKNDVNTSKEVRECRVSLKQ